VRGVGRRRAWDPGDAWELWEEADPGPGEAGVKRIAGRASELITAALYADDAEAAGVHAAALLADTRRAIRVLGGPMSAPAARHAVIQRFGGVGALLVIACEEASAQAELAAGASGEPVPDEQQDLHHLLDRLLRGFGDMTPDQLDSLLVAIAEADGAVTDGEGASARRWLNVTYAIAARDGTDDAHRAYVHAFDRVLALTRPLVAS
jgi:hypothetical protein